MKRLYVVVFGLVAMMVASSVASAQMMKENPMVGGAAMYPTKTIVANAMNSADQTTLVAAVKAAGLVDTLNGKGPFTVFAPTTIGSSFIICAKAAELPIIRAVAATITAKNLFISFLPCLTLKL